MNTAEMVIKCVIFIVYEKYNSKKLTEFLIDPCFSQCLKTYQTFVMLIYYLLATLQILFSNNW